MKKLFTAVVFLLFVNPAVYAAKPDHASGKQLPPGLQKKMNRGGVLPPGWQKKLKQGAVLDREIYEASTPVSDSLKVKLPVGPSGTIDIQIEGRIVRIYKATRIIQAVFESL